ncbi:MAG: family 20 glycosylhydrolase [Acetobacter sp.]
MTDKGVSHCATFAPVWKTQRTPLLEQAWERFQTRQSQRVSGKGVGKSCRVQLSVSPDDDWLTVAQKENYRLKVADEQIILNAGGPAGMLHGLSTLLQLGQDGAGLPHVEINDAPRFRWRGLMIDVARHFMSVAALRRQIDAMELTKLNVLHLHLNDGAAFRVESHVFPRLQMIGAHGQYYTQEDIRALVRYAADRGVRIVPEFDVPGHAMAILEAYPDLAAAELPAANAACTGSSACVAGGNINNPALDPTNGHTMDFVRKLFAEMAGLFPDRYFHAGGDEVVASQWTHNPKIVAAMKAGGYADTQALQGAFTASVQAFLASQGKTVIGWDEILSAPLSKDAVVESWRASKWTAAAVQAGHPVIVSAGYYLDLLRPTREHYRVDPLDMRAIGLSGEELDYAHRTHFRMADAFALDPDMPSLKAEQERLVLGGEAALWTEVVSEPMLDQRVWPRTAAIAERFWSPASVRDTGDMEQRLPQIEAELEALVLHTPHDRQVMIDDFGTRKPETIANLVDVTSPVRNYTINRMAKKTGDAILSWPIAIATPDSFTAMRFNRLAEAYVRGDRSVEPVLRRDLRRWSDNDHVFESISEETADLKMVRPISAQLAALARLGLDVLDGKAGTSTFREKARTLLAEQDRAQAASSWQLLPPPLPQPAGGLLINIVPGVKMLVESQTGKAP